MRRLTLFQGSLAICALAMIWPLFMADYLPLVDLPQHLHLINVWAHLDDPGTLYPEIFKARGEITPYEGYYLVVRALAAVFPLLTANRVFLAIVAAATVLSILALCKALGRSGWLCLLACPFFYGDNLYWGFINYCAALPLLFFAMALFVAILEREPQRLPIREVGLALLLIAVQLTHVQAFVYAGFALPLMLAMTPSDMHRRIRAVAAAVPGALLFAIWSLGRLGEKPDIVPGEPWKAWGPLLSSANLSFQPVEANWKALPGLLANGFRDGSDQPVVWLVLALGVAGALASFQEKPAEDFGGWRIELRPLALAAIALVMFLYMPFDVRGYMYYVNYRFAELFALVLVVAGRVPGGKLGRAFGVAAVVLNLWYAQVVASHFERFQGETRDFDQVITHTGERPKIMALSYDTQSLVMTHPVFLHFASYDAMAHGGITSFSFAATAHSPLAYRGDPPPGPTSEWRADQFRYDQYGSYYDYYLTRGRVSPDMTFRGDTSAIEVAAKSGLFTLYHRVTRP